MESTCAACSHANRPGRKFCAACGAPLALACQACGSANEPGERFCGDCGQALDITAPKPRAIPSVERRLVSVLFADLVGFTPLAETRDAEEVRELLSRYFDTAQEIIERYGGTVEKFIGDAVMAVWGTPVAQEDDAERAVRAALDLVAAVSALGGELGADSLAARAGVVTGEAAVTLGATGQGMVAGDLVNTASRVQAAAEPGTVLVGESTRRPTEAAIAYADPAPVEVKGKEAPLQLSRALRVTAARGGGLKSERLEPPFVGRERELRLVKELFHASAEERKAHLVSVVGIAGIGKSRLVWELYKYLDGLAGGVLWHRGRCLAYGDGVTYSALTEMIRSRAGIAEGEAAEPARAKLDAMLELYVADEEERGWVAPRLAQLLALEERQAPDQSDLFAGCRLFLERLAERNPVVLVFEDVQWADAALLDFVDYVLEWSRNHPIFVLALARPEIAARAPASGWRNATTLPLSPLAPAAMEALVDGFVPGLPDDVRAQILGQAEGVPLYAVETVRMLLDRGLLERHGEEYRTAGSIGALAVPETLHALVAARLDSLEPEERRLLQDAAVVGKTFTTDALAAVSELPPEALDTILVRLIRKEVLSLDQDPRSPERGQYGFLQDLLRQVAFETLARREQKSRHLLAAAYLARQASGDEFAEVVAAHYVAAHDADPDARDAVEIRAQAKAMLARAGERAASLAAVGEAQRYFERALELADAPREQAELQERAGRMAHQAAHVVEARTHFERAIETLESMGLTHPAARVAAALAELKWAHENRTEEAIVEMERALAVLADEERDGDVATLAAQLGKLFFFAGRSEDAFPQLELALEIAESLQLPDVLSQALNTKALILHASGRRQEATVLMRHALEVALEHDLAGTAQRAYNNLSHFAAVDDRMVEALEIGRAALELACRVGNRRGELWHRSERVADLALTGAWDEAFAEAEELSREEAAGLAELGITIRWRLIIPLVHTGRVAEARDVLLSGEWRDADAQVRAIHRAVEAIVLLGEEHCAEALAAAEEALALGHDLGLAHPAVRLALTAALEASFALGNEVKADELLALIEALPPGALTRYLRATGAHFAAHRATLRRDAATASAAFVAAAELFREIALPFELARTLLAHAEWLAGEGKVNEAEPLLVEARELFERLRATPWLDRLDRVAPVAVPG